MKTVFSKIYLFFKFWTISLFFTFYSIFHHLIKHFFYEFFSIFWKIEFLTKIYFFSKISILIGKYTSIFINTYNLVTVHIIYFKINFLYAIRKQKRIKLNIVEYKNCTNQVNRLINLINIILLKYEQLYLKQNME